MLKKQEVSPIISNNKETSEHHLLLRFKLLVRGFYHLVLFRQVDPKLKAARIGLARFMYRHFSVDDWKSH